MKKFLLIFAIVLFLYSAQVLLFNIVSNWLVPNLLLLFFVFLGLSIDSKYSFFAAAVSGFIKDSFASSVIGVNLVSFLLCAYILSLFRKYLYHPHSSLSPVLVSLAILLINEVLHFIFYLAVNEINLAESLRMVILPQVAATLMFYPLVYYIFRKCVLR